MGIMVCGYKDVLSKVIKCVAPLLIQSISHLQEKTKLYFDKNPVCNWQLYLPFNSLNRNALGQIPRTVNIQLLQHCNVEAQEL